MTKAIWKGTVLAESDRVETVEGNAYFPPDSVKREYLRPTDAHTVCPWKGVASYYDVVVNGAVNKEAAWYLPGAETSGGENHGLCGVLEGRRSNALRQFCREDPYAGFAASCRHYRLCIPNNIDRMLIQTG